MVAIVGIPSGGQAKQQEHLMTLSDEQWEQRRLCSDGNCIGVVGTYGRCKVCGLNYAGQIPSSTDEDRSKDGESADPLTEAPDSGYEVQAADPPVAPDKPAVDMEWESRRLCIDESCIGVIGPDGRCKECGKTYPESNRDGE